jgi:hypothetical protein
MAIAFSMGKPRIGSAASVTAKTEREHQNGNDLTAGRFGWNDPADMQSGVRFRNVPAPSGVREVS